MNFSHNIKQLGTCYSSQKENAVNVLLRLFTKYTVPKGKVPLLNQQKKIDFIFCIYIWLFFHLSQPAFSSSLSQVAFPFEALCFNELYGLCFQSSLSCVRYLGFFPSLCLKPQKGWGQFGAAEGAALPWTPNPKVFCTENRKKKSKITCTFISHGFGENFTTRQIEM